MTSPSLDSYEVHLIGAGVVGRAILKTHIDAQVSVCLVDQDEIALQAAIDELPLTSEWHRESIALADGLPAVTLKHSSIESKGSGHHAFVIESIAERLDWKQAFFKQAEKLFGESAILCSNTSTLRISDIASGLEHPERFCGMHFFMPVDQRFAVELIGGPQTNQDTLRRARDHIDRLGKQTLVVSDGPGFVVNRLLSPYLNQAMSLLERGVEAAQIETAARAYGMPLSPLELADWIGTRTMFDAGRVYWQAFPNRIDPSPILPALLKSKRMGRAVGQGFYEYQGSSRSEALAPATVEICQRYQRESINLTDNEVQLLLALPMWIEAGLAMQDGVAKSLNDLDLAMRGGLGYQPESWLGYFDLLGSPRISQELQRWSSSFKALHAPNWLLESLERGSPTEAFKQSKSGD